MLKHMLTTKCPRSCEYCITRNVKAKEAVGPEADVATCELYEKLYREGHKEIMFTGGEPTSAKGFVYHVLNAKARFDRVHMTTQNEEILSSDAALMFDSIVFSLHDGYTGQKVTNGAKVYASILADQYSTKLVTSLMAAGFAGLAINEEQREGSPFDEYQLPRNLKTFSFKINRRGHCMNETIILPDLRVITDFTPYL